MPNMPRLPQKELMAIAGLVIVLAAGSVTSFIAPIWTADPTVLTTNVTERRTETRNGFEMNSDHGNGLTSRVTSSSVEYTVESTRTVE